MAADQAMQPRPKTPARASGTGTSVSVPAAPTTAPRSQDRQDAPTSPMAQIGARNRVVIAIWAYESG